MFTEKEYENFKTIGINELTNVFNTKQYVQDKYNVVVYNNQIEIFENIISPLERHIVIGQARGAGKSYGVALSLIELCRTTPKLIVAIFAPKGPQSKRLLNEMYQIIASSTTLVKDAINWEKSSSMVMEFMNGAKVQALSGNDKTMSEGEHPNCMDYFQNILLENRSEMPIGYIVENKINANVVCYNELKKEYEIKPIIGWHKNKLNGRKMLRISFQYDKINRIMECTEDHEILMLEGYKQAKQIITGDKDFEGWEVKWSKEIKNYNQEHVYDITVKDNHNYIANSILVHNCVVVDESLDGNSKILCDDKKYRTIKDIVKNKLNVNVATQNLETNEIEYVPILNYWEYPCTKECVMIDYEVNGKNLQLKCTEDHLIYTANRGYVQAKDLTPEDNIVIHSKKCENCGKEFITDTPMCKTCCTQCKNEMISKTEHKTKDKSIVKICPTCKKEFKVMYKHRKKKFCSKQCRIKILRTKCAYCGKMISYYSNRVKKYCCSECFQKHRKEKHPRYKNKCVICGKSCERKYCSSRCFGKNRLKAVVCICGKTIKEGKISKKYCSTECLNKAQKIHKENSIERMCKNNPMRFKETRLKMAQTQKERISNMSFEEKQVFLKNWMNAPKYNKKNHKPTKPERIIMSFNIKGLQYKGDGSLWLTFKNGKHKNPDFIKGKHIVEVGDFQYWHTEEEKREVIQNYRDIGYKCLYLSTEQIYDNPNIQSEIERFLML